MSFLKSVRTLEYDLPVLAIEWNEVHQSVLIAREVIDGVLLELLDPATYISIDTKLLPAISGLFKVVRDDAGNVLLIALNNAYLFSWKENQIAFHIHYADGFRNGGVMDDKRAWLVIHDYSDSVDWAYWNYAQGKLDEYCLEDHGVYRRGATLHPSGLLIGCCWSDNECGFILHQAIPDGKKLLYFEMPEEEVHPAHEAFAPCFNPEGDRYGYVIMFSGDHRQQICVYPLADATTALHSIPYAGERIWRLQFIGRNHMLGVAGKELLLVDLQKNQITPHPFETSPGRFDVITNSGNLCIAQNNKLEFFAGEWVPSSVLSSQEKSNEHAKRYIENNKSYLLPAGDKSVYFNVQIDLTHEYPLLDVRFDREWAFYRLFDRSMIVEENISNDTRAAVAAWFDEHQEKKLQQWKDMHGHKLYFPVADDNGTEFIVFTGKIINPSRPHIRVYHDYRRTNVDLQLPCYVHALPTEIQHSFYKWLCSNMQAALRDWQNDKHAALVAHVISELKAGKRAPVKASSTPTILAVRHYDGLLCAILLIIGIRHDEDSFVYVTAGVLLMNSIFRCHIIDAPYRHVIREYTRAHSDLRNNPERLVAGVCCAWLVYPIFFTHLQSTLSATSTRVLVVLLILYAVLPLNVFPVFRGSQKK